MTQYCGARLPSLIKPATWAPQIYRSLSPSFHNIYSHSCLNIMSNSTPPPKQPSDSTPPPNQSSDSTPLPNQPSDSGSSPPPQEAPCSRPAEDSKDEEEPMLLSVDKLDESISSVQEALTKWGDPAGQKALSASLKNALRQQRDFKRVFDSSEKQKGPFWAAAKDFLFEPFATSRVDGRLDKLREAVDDLMNRASAHAELDRIIQEIRSMNQESRNSISQFRRAVAQAGNPTPAGQPAPRGGSPRSGAAHSPPSTRGVEAPWSSRITFNSPTSSRTGARLASNQQTPVYQNRQGMASQPAFNSQYASQQSDNMAPPQPALPTSGMHGAPQYAATPSAHGSPPAFEQQPQEWLPLSATLPRAGAPRLGQSRSADTYSSTTQRRPIPPFAQQFEGNTYQRSVALMPLPVPQSASLPPPSPRNRGPRTNPGATGSRHDASQAQYSQQPIPAVLTAPVVSPEAPESSEQAQTRASFGSAFGFSREPRARSTRSKNSTTSSDIYEEDEYYEK
ncbi:hypothetical protein D9611_012883 [Ephemerocybe angulata]|uniref:Uncharacterized protein n=1 Tax=Ephemerocybe angulata TaxID=980116 RepID=A0A8H5F1F3_9AGAR|nr:hypothetical protein D9611_012883 [Tulosesus angulatus]